MYFCSIYIFTTIALRKGEIGREGREKRREQKRERDRERERRKEREQESE
jgi:hypothetical protein